MSDEQIHTILERFCALLRVEARAHGAADGLLPVQIEVLHYLSQCNRYSDTLQGVTEFLGQTKGTVSQTVKILESRGLVSKVPDANDRRLVHIRITSAGRGLLSKVVPAQFLVEGLQTLPANDIQRTAKGLRELLRAVQSANHFKSFAACKTCRFNEKSDNGFRCGLTNEALCGSDIELICREHQYSRSSR